MASINPKNDAVSGGVAAGMRAISIRVSESSGLMGLLRTGSRVDLQAVSDRNGAAELRTILQNVEVQRVSPQLEPVGNSRQPVPVASVLVPAQYADLIALADSGARLRITLRNPLDEGTAPRHALGLASVFSSAAVSEPQRPRNGAVPEAVSTVEHEVELNVQVLGASPAAMGQLIATLDSSERSGMQVAAFRSDANPEELIHKLEQSRELELVSSSVLSSGVGRQVSVRAAAAPYRLRVQFSPAVDSQGKSNLRVQPEFSLRTGSGVETRRYDADLPAPSSFLVKGFLQDQNDPAILSRLYPGHSWNGRELVIYVTARPHGTNPSSSVARSSRRP